MAKKKALGRGLSALIRETEEAYESNIGDNSDLVIEIDVDLIYPNPYQPRKTFNEASLIELSDSIKRYGVIQPILVYEDNNDYFLIAGERRLKASKLAKMSSIKAIVIDIELNKLRELALIENIQREDLNPIDLALSYETLIREYDITQEDLANRLSKSRVNITNTISLLRLPDYVKRLLIDGTISQGHAKVLVNLNKDDCKLVVDSIIGQKMSVRDTEKLVRSIKTSKTNKNIHKSCIIDKNIHNKLSLLSNLLDSKFEIKSKISNNSLVIEVFDLNKIDCFIGILNKV